ncbi:16S rRNA (cytosine(1402)-N(4))-methyltransferase RsmH [Candidatus Babeliales bacterium]|nr:16S rRNA (cytosine(1402)-N(4))-methyltransferase RsmH [Candidatus Babeliales bacterium]
MELKIQKHIPVLLNEVLQYLDPKPGQLYVDATLGGAGHTRAILQKEPNCKVIGIDWDKTVIDTTGQALMEEFPDRFVAILGNFSKITSLLHKHHIDKVDGILADFGTSQIQIKNTPGFSIYENSFLDMRFNPGMYRVTAYDVINRFNPERLTQMFFDYGQEPHARKIARAIAEQRKIKKIETTHELAQLIKNLTPGNYHKIHPATKVFQALRIFVNDELENINSFLQAAKGLLKDQGRLVCISFHSLEDRIVKQYFKQHSAKNPTPGFFLMATDGACMATQEEINANRSSRSARLRAGILQDFV